MKLAILNVGSPIEPRYILAVGRDTTSPDQAQMDVNRVLHPVTTDQAPQHLFEFARLLEVAQNESARGVVLVYSAMLDEQLKRAIDAFLVDHADVLKLTEGFNAPIGTFSTRMLLALALGLVGDIEYKELVLIRKIRNAFAHSIDMTFDQPSVSSRCKLLPGGIPEYPSPRDQFTAAAASLVLNLLNRAHYASKKRLSFAAWPV